MEYSKNAVLIKQQAILLRMTFLLLLGALTIVSNARASQELAVDLKRNVVSIISEWQDQSRQNGFGFIVGEKNGEAYIVTANHVVRRDDPDDPSASDITIKYFQDQGASYKAELLETTDSSHDLAVLRTEIPQEISWRRDAAKDGDVVRNTEVWYVGRSGDWRVPTQPGTVNEVDLSDRISIDNLNVQVGTSGAPLISNDGIIGMMVADEGGGVSQALTMVFIRKAIKKWSLPWNLTELKIPIPEPFPDPEVAKPSECSFSGLVFDSGTNKPLSSVWIDLQEDKGKPSKKLKTLVATTGPRGKFTINCSEFDESQFPLVIALRHRDWGATNITGTKIERSGKREGINISVNTRTLVKKSNSTKKDSSPKITKFPTVKLRPPLPASRWMTSRAYQAEYNKNVEKGFYPSKVTGMFGRGKEELFKADWKPRPSRKFYFISHHGMTIKTYETNKRLYKSRGFSRESVTRFKGASGIMKYQATWTKK